MVNRSAAARLDAVFSALADPTRRTILARLARGETSVGMLAAPFDVSLPAISRHLRVLERAGLVQREQDGRMRRCRLVAHPMRDVAAWIERYRQFWETQFDALARYLESSDQPDSTARRSSPRPRKESTHANRLRSQPLAIRAQGPGLSRRKGHPVRPRGNHPRQRHP